MTEWDAAEYSRRSGLQEAMAQEVLALLDLKGSERVLDVGCGDGKITAEVATRVPRGEVLGVDASQDMITFASSHFGPAVRPNLRFEVADARRLPFKNEFDLVISFNALHWVPEQDAALRSIRSAMRSDGRALLRLVPAGERKSLENVVEETRLSSRWVAYFREFHDPYLHLTPEAIRSLAERNGLAYCVFTRKRRHGISNPVRHFLLSARWALSNGPGICLSPSGRRSSTMFWITISLSPRIVPAKRILSSSIRWMSRLRRPR